MDFLGKNVLISGGSSGIGLSLGKALSSLGANVTILARRKQQLDIALTEIQSKSKTKIQVFKKISADVSKFDELSAAFSADNTDYDFLFNSAGIAYPGEFVDLDHSIFKETMDINYLGTVYLTKIILPRMIEKKSGYIINFSSYVSLVGYYGYTAYAPSKYAVRGFSRTLRPELKPYGIDVSLVIPQDTDTPQLEFEQSHLPDVTKKSNQLIEKIFGASSLISAENAAKYIIQGIEKKRFSIYFGTMGLLTSYLTPLIDKLLFRYTVNLAKKKIAN